ncbi:ribonuclease P protein component [Patescibacteria group bacterium]|nr:ribonuclease P protein component [Patescibacteria group bacterium]MBU0964040.1 ribonuclease P protein component [Patescibacteria group bacterium]
MLPRYQRVIKDSDWRRIHARGSAVHSSYFVVKKLPNKNKDSRFGISIGVKVSKQATRRNQIKRQLRAIIQQEAGRIKTSYDIIFIVRPAILQAKFSEIRKQVINTFSKAKLYK